MSSSDDNNNIFPSLPIAKNMLKNDATNSRQINEKQNTVENMNINYNEEEPQLTIFPPVPIQREEQEFIFSHKQKIMILIIVIMAFMISVLPIYIYAPSLPSITKEFHSTDSIVNISVTGYTVITAFFPTVSGVLADLWGRGPVVLIALPITITSCIGIALSRNVYTLIIMRMFAAIGDSTVRIVARGIITDISTPTTRATYTAYSFMGAQVSMITGPVIGGILAQHLSWRWIFWILLCITGFVSLVIIIYLPETLESLAGGYYNRSLLQYIRNQKDKYVSSSKDNNNNSNNNRDIAGIDYSKEDNIEKNKPFKTFRNFKTPYQYFTFPDLLLVMLISGIHFGLISCYMVHLSYLLRDYYQMDVESAGLCFLVLGIADVIGAICGAYYQDYVFRKVTNAYYTSKEYKNMDDEQHVPVVFGTNKPLPIDFPIFKARLLYIWPCSIVIQLCTVIFGWIFVTKTHLVIPLITLFCLSFTMAIVDDSTVCLTQDLQPNKGTSISGSLNLVQGVFGGTATAIVGPLSSSIGVEWTYTLLGSILMTTNIMLLVLLRKGVVWRTQREEKTQSDVVV